MKSSSLCESVLQEREVTCNQQKKLHAKLEYLKTTFSKYILDTALVKNAALFTSPELLSGIGDTQIHKSISLKRKIQFFLVFFLGVLSKKNFIRPFQRSFSLA